MRLLACVIIATLAHIPAQAGICKDKSQTPRPRHELRLLAGYSPYSPTLIGTAKDRTLGIAEVSYSYRCWSWNRIGISYTGALMPAVLLSQPAQTESFITPSGNVGFRTVASHTAYGFAVMPVGFLVDIASQRRVHPIAEIAGGIVASSEPIPVRGINATGLNFLFYFGGGIRWQVKPSQSATFGYRFLHISNAETTNFNPGLDASVFYVSYSFLR